MAVETRILDGQEGLFQMPGDPLKGDHFPLLDEELLDQGAVIGEDAGDLSRPVGFQGFDVRQLGDPRHEPADEHTGEDGDRDPRPDISDRHEYAPSGRRSEAVSITGPLSAKISRIRAPGEVLYHNCSQKKKMFPFHYHHQRFRQMAGSNGLTLAQTYHKIKENRTQEVRIESPSRGLGLRPLR